MITRREVFMGSSEAAHCTYCLFTLWPFFCCFFCPKTAYYHWLPVFIAGATVFAFAHYRKIRKYQETSENRRSEIAKLSKKLKKEDLLNKDSAWYKDVVTNKMKNQKRIRILNYLIIMSALIVIIIDLVDYLKWLR